MSSIVLDPASPPPTARDQLRAALADPSLEIVYWHHSAGTWLDALGQALVLPAPDQARAVTLLEREGDWVAALLHDPELLERPDEVRAACAAVTVAIDDEQLKAALRARVREEQASRARTMAASDRQRRRFEHNLHDGAQQRLVGVALMLRLASKGAADDAVTALLAEAVRELDDAIEDLRELARGLHPAIVSDAGLAAAVESLAEHPGIPVELALDVPDRLSDAVEVAAYYLVAECLANAKKHSGADVVRVRIQVVDEVLEVMVTDDGVGGASLAGSGLTGLVDRLGALGGRLVIESAAGHGTTVVGTIPLEQPTATSLHHVDDILLRVVRADDGQGPLTPGTERHRRWLRGDLDRRRRALKWIAWQSFAAPGEIIEAQPESEDLLHAKAMLLFVGGNTQISDQRRDWIIGYLTAAGYSENVLEAARTYDDADRIEDIVALPRIAIALKVLLYDALRTCAFDSDKLSPDAFDPVLRAADAIGISRDLVADLHAIVLEELRLRQRRHDIVVAPALPKLLNDSLAAIADGADRTN